jgi:uncharacterized peroxidase-related enzyme
LLTKDKRLLAALEHDPRSAPLNQRQRTLIDYALKLTLAPIDVCEEDLVPLRQAGLSDTAIHDAAAITAYFNFVNRLASGLGVDLGKNAHIINKSQTCITDQDK